MVLGSLPENQKPEHPVICPRDRLTGLVLSCYAWRLVGLPSMPEYRGGESLSDTHVPLHGPMRTLFGHVPGAGWDARKSRNWLVLTCISCASTTSRELMSGELSADASFATTAVTTSGMLPAMRCGILRSIVLTTCAGAGHLRTCMYLYSQTPQCSLFLAI